MTWSRPDSDKSQPDLCGFEPSLVASLESHSNFSRLCWPLYLLEDQQSTIEALFSTSSTNSLFHHSRYNGTNLRALNAHSSWMRWLETHRQILRDSVPRIRRTNWWIHYFVAVLYKRAISLVSSSMKLHGLIRCLYDVFIWGAYAMKVCTDQHVTVCNSSDF